MEHFRDFEVVLDRDWRDGHWHENMFWLISLFEWMLLVHCKEDWKDFDSVMLDELGDEELIQEGSELAEVWKELSGFQSCCDMVSCKVILECTALLDNSEAQCL